MSEILFGTTEAVHSIRDLKLNRNEKYLLIMLAACMNANNQTWYSISELAAMLDCSETTVKKYYKILNLLLLKNKVLYGFI